MAQRTARNLTWLAPTWLAVAGAVFTAPDAVGPACAQQLPPSLPLTEAFGAPPSEGGASREAVELTLPLSNLWASANTPSPKPRPTTPSERRPAEVNTGLRTRWAVGANMEMANVHARTGNASLTTPLLDNLGKPLGRPHLSGDDSFVLMDGQRTPGRTVGLDLSYGRTDRQGRGLSIGGSVGFATYDAPARRQPIGTTHLKLSF